MFTYSSAVELPRERTELCSKPSIPKISQMKVRGYKIFYSNALLANQTLQEIFFDRSYLFKAANSQPVIIDAGSNIGIATLYFKHIYPDAKITCFEPDPNAFKLLTMNIHSNRLQNIDLINAALANTQDKYIRLYGQINEPNPDSRGNSIVPDWGIQRKQTSSTDVPAQRLSDHLVGPIDLLKLDIEGVEQEVLEECESKLHFVKEIIMEVHCTNSMRNRNSLHSILALLARQNFDCTAEQIHLGGVLPAETNEWAKKNKPKFHLVKARNMAYS